MLFVRVLWTQGSPNLPVFVVAGGRRVLLLSWRILSCMVAYMPDAMRRADVVDPISCCQAGSFSETRQHFLGPNEDRSRNVGCSGGRGIRVGLSWLIKATAYKCRCDLTRPAQSQSFDRGRRCRRATDLNLDGKHGAKAKRRGKDNSVHSYHHP